LLKKRSRWQLKSTPYQSWVIFSFQMVNSNVRSWFFFKLPLLDHITTEHGRLKIRDYLPLQDPVIPPFIRKTFLSLWTLFRLKYIPKESSFSPLSNGISEYKTYPAFDFFLWIALLTHMHRTGVPMAKLSLNRAAKSSVHFRLGISR
jgi:hypothetical protein